MYQYYPTGVKTAAIMWSKFRKVPTHVCDPSAGQGYLLAFAKNGFPGVSDDILKLMYESEGGKFHSYFRTKFSNIRRMSAVEIDLRHHASLRNIGINILGCDFLQTESLATVSHVIMNPPFSEGAKHVLHAWKCVYDAEIVAIVNAETIRNPYSQERKALVSLIEKYGSVEFLQDQFIDDVERKTNVEVALIYLEKVPPKFLDMNSIIDDLAVDTPDLRVNVEVCNTLALPTDFIQNTVIRFRQAVVAARKASESIAIANHSANAIGITLAKMQTKGVDNNFREASEDLRKKVEADFKERYCDLQQRAWSQIIRSTLLTDKISNQARRKLESSSEEIYSLEFSTANVHGFLAGVIRSMGDIYKDMICDLFDSIIERSSDNAVFYKSWKSNQKHRIGARIKKSRFIIPGFKTYSNGELEYESKQFLSDIDKVFGYLHGISEPYEGLVHGATVNKLNNSTCRESKFFNFRYYPGTSTIHFYPKSVEVVDKLNKFVGQIRNWIPCDMNEANADFKKQYDDAEKLTKEYTKKSGNHCATVHQLKCLYKGLNANKDNLEKMDKAIADVHFALNIQCGPAIASPEKQGKITRTPYLLTKDTKYQQLDLLAD